MVVIKKKFYFIYERIRRINWKSGGSAILFYISMMWIVALCGILFVEYYNTFSHGVKTQLIADIVSDGAAYNGDNGWGLDKTVARKTANELVSYNEGDIEDVNVRISFSSTNANGEPISTPAKQNNTVNVTAKLNTKTLTTNEKIKETTHASTKITYAGGMRVVMEAYKHSYQYAQKNGTNSQTKYIWGGGHGSDDLSWEQYADCSGFVSGVFRKCGYYIPSWACTGNMESMGTLVGIGTSAYENARPGDIILIWWSSASGSSDHVTIYAGKGKDGTHYMIHSRGGQANASVSSAGSGPTGGVNLTPAAYSAAKIMVRRIVDCTATVSDTPERSVHGLTGDEAIIYNALSDFGYNDIAIAGIMGNFSLEGQCHPTTREGHSGGNADPANVAYAERIRKGLVTKQQFVYENRGNMGHYGSEGYGIAQWTTTSWGNPYADRKARLWDCAVSRGSNVTDLYVQLAFALQEFQTSHSRMSADSYKNSSDLTYAAYFALTYYEGIDNGTAMARTNLAENYYYKFTHIP